MFQPVLINSPWHSTKKNLAKGAIFAALLALPASVDAAPVSVEANYVVSVAGTIVADLGVRLVDTGAQYSLDLDANVAGLGNLLARGSANIEATGRSNTGSFSSEDFHLQTRSSEGAVDVNVTYTNANVTTFIVEPPLRPRVDQVPIERNQLRGVNDMLSAFIIKADGLDRSICNRTLKIFTGVERFDLSMRYATSETATSARTGYQGPVVLCQLSYNPVSGHYTNSEITAYLQTSERMLIWYAPLANTNTFIPYRVLIGTSLGDLSMVLTRLE